MMKKQKTLDNKQFNLFIFLYFICQPNIISLTLFFLLFLALVVFAQPELSRLDKK